MLLPALPPVYTYCVALLLRAHAFIWCLLLLPLAAAAAGYRLSMYGNCTGCVRCIEVVSSDIVPELMHAWQLASSI
jgi:hypothetical protein